MASQWSSTCSQSRIFSRCRKWQRLSGQRVQDDQGNEFLRKLARAVIIGAIRDERGEPIGFVIGPHEMIAGRLGCRIGLFGAYGVVSVKAGSPGRSVPYTSSVETCRKRKAFRLSSDSSFHHPIRRAGGCRFRGHWCGQTHPGHGWSDPHGSQRQN